MDSLDTFIANAKRLMGERGWKNIDLARKAGLPPTTVGTILNRAHENPGFGKMEAIAKALGTTLPRMLEPDSEYTRHLRNIERAPPADREFIFSVAERAAKYGEDG